ncbi:MAG: diguanylate cyclase [Pseudomonadota bacterium]
MGDYPVPSNENERQRALRSLNILDTTSEEFFDRMTGAVAAALDVPISLVSLVDADRQWFKSKVGLDAEETDREVSFCAHAICDSSLMEVSDAQRDERFRDNPLVTGEPNIRFYAGVPLRSKTGHNVGTLCAIDRQPRTLTPEQRDLLEDFAAIVSDHLELRLANERAQLAENRLLDAVDALPDGFVLYDHEDRLVLCNDRYRAIYAESAHAMVQGATFESIIRAGVENGQYPEAAGQEEEWISERLRRHKQSDISIEQSLPGDRWLRIEERRTREGGYVGFRVNITELKRQQRELARLAWTDSLTGALNRRRFWTLGNLELNRAMRSGSPVSMIVLDVDHFKSINDAYGHAAGDAVLVELVGRWTEALRGHDILGRMGGEEFAILLPDTDLQGAVALAERLREQTADRGVASGEHHIQATVSAGIYQIPEGGVDLEDCLKNADDALYRAKEAGRNQVMALAA